MDLQAERVDQLICSKCACRLDPKQYKPLASIRCPQCQTPMHVPARFDKFLLTEPIGQGTSGIAFRAFDDQLHRQVALKILRRDNSDDDKIAKDCIAEARALASLNHPGIVQIYSIGLYLGQHYFVMELLSEKTAYHYCEPARLLSEQQVLDLTIRVTEALKAAQRMGLVHMDIKPQNILFSRDSLPKLIDFGAARFAKDKGPEGKVIGTPYYIAPEVARGKTPDFKSDIYNLGATLFHLLAAQPPFLSENPIEVVKMRLKGPAPSIYTYRQNVGPATAEVIDRMLAMDPQDRYESYDDLLEHLREAREGANDEAAILLEEDGSPREVEPSGGRPARPQSPGGRPASPNDTSRPSSPIDVRETERVQVDMPSGDNAELTSLALAATTGSMRPTRTVSKSIARSLARTRSKKKGSAAPLFLMAGVAAVILVIVIAIVASRGGGSGDSDSGSGQSGGGSTTPPGAVNHPPTARDADVEAKGQDIVRIEAQDPDPNDRLTFSILSGDPNGAFSIDAAGQLRLSNPGRLLRGQKAAFLQIEVEDSGSPPQKAIAKVRIRKLDAFAPK